MEGELPEDGLAAYGDDGDDLMLALARKIVAGEETPTRSSRFSPKRSRSRRRPRRCSSTPGGPRPSRWSSRFTPTATAAPPLPVGGHVDDEPPERQRSLFSWAEFMAGESGEPKHRRRDEAPTLSLFEWALDREREGELVGAER